MPSIKFKKTNGNEKSINSISWLNLFSVSISCSFFLIETITVPVDYRPGIGLLEESEGCTGAN